MNVKQEIQDLIVSIAEESDPFQKAFELLVDLAEKLDKALEAPFTCRVGHNFRIELWLDSTLMSEPLVQLQVAGDDYILITSTINSDMVETNREGLQSGVLKFLMDPMGVKFLRVACMHHQD
jgi:hypothetical protein